jgi:hypothetical protein
MKAINHIYTYEGEEHRGNLLTGEGKCKREAASFSGGASNDTTGAPKVRPIIDAREPPRECPERYKLLESSTQTLSREYHSTPTNYPDTCTRVQVSYVIVEILYSIDERRARKNIFQKLTIPTL